MKNQSPVKTKERIEYEHFIKDARILDLKANMSEQGIDISKVSRQELDEIIRLINKQTDLSREIQENEQQTQAEIAEIAKEAEAIIDSIMREQQVGQYAIKPEPLKDKVPGAE